MGSPVVNAVLVKTVLNILIVGFYIRLILFQIVRMMGIVIYLHDVLIIIQSSHLLDMKPLKLVLMVLIALCSQNVLLNMMMNIRQFAQMVLYVLITLNVCLGILLAQFLNVNMAGVVSISQNAVSSILTKTLLCVSLANTALA